MDFFGIGFSPSLSATSLPRRVEIGVVCAPSGMLEGEFAQSTSHVQSYDSIADITIKLLTRRGRSR